MSWVTPKTNWRNFEYATNVDWNRIQGNTEYVTNYLNSIGFVLPTFTPTYLQNWAYPYLDLANELAEQINAIVDAIMSGSNQRKVKIRFAGDMAWDATDWNTIESVLLFGYNYQFGGNKWQDLYDNYTWNTVKDYTWNQIKLGE